MKQKDLDDVDTVVGVRETTKDPVEGEEVGEANKQRERDCR